jgi:SAM-dependent methyltransferase
MTSANAARSGMLARGGEAPGEVWDAYYRRGAVPWRSGGLSDPAARFLSAYAPARSLLEIGCGTADDAVAIARLGFEYTGVDTSTEAIRVAAGRKNEHSFRFLSADVFKWEPRERFDVVYDKGLFHGLAGPRRRSTLVRRIARLLNPNGVWITVCGAADRRRSDFGHGAIYLRDLVLPAEIYFEVLEVLKAPYSLADKDHDFEAWHAAFRRRG